MPSTRYRLTYFPLKGRAELIRLIFYTARVPFEDRRIPFAVWPDLKPKTPTGTLPMLEMNGEKFGESGAIANWAARKFGLMGKTDAEQLKTEAIVIQATELRETYIFPLIEEKDPMKTEVLKQQLEIAVDKVFTKWEANVVQTESNGRKVFSYMVTQAMTAADLALLYVVDLAEYYIKVDWTHFPHLQAVIQTVSALPHLKAYLTKRESLGDASKALPTPRPHLDTHRAEGTSKERTSPMPVATPRGKETPTLQPVPQKA